MVTQSNRFDSECCPLRSNATWEKLYLFLRSLVEYWVYSARPLWYGQEEEIAAEIVQEAVSDTFRYALHHFHGVYEKDFAFSKLLERISVTLAYKHYKKQQQHDSSFVFVRTYNIFAQSYALLAWRPDPFEKILQERYCRCLAGAILKIPVRPRAALLTYLANRLDLKNQAVSLQHALLKKGIDLRTYQRLMPTNLQEQSEYKASFQAACQRLVQEIGSDNDVLIEPESEPAFLSELECEYVKLDPEFLDLMVQLEVTAPVPFPDLSFRENLRDTLRTRFLQIVEQREEKHECTILETRLEAEGPPVRMDPVFYEKLWKAMQEKLRSMPTGLPIPPGVEEVIRDTTQAIVELRKLSEESTMETEENWPSNLSLLV